MTHEPPYPQYAEVVAIPLAQHGSGNAVPQSVSGRALNRLSRLTTRKILIPLTVCLCWNVAPDDETTGRQKIYFIDFKTLAGLQPSKVLPGLGFRV